MATIINLVVIYEAIMAYRNCYQEKIYGCYSYDDKNMHCHIYTTSKTTYLGCRWGINSDIGLHEGNWPVVNILTTDLRYRICGQGFPRDWSPSWRDVWHVLDSIVLTTDWHFGSILTIAFIEFQSFTVNQTTNLVPSRLWEILQLDVMPDIGASEIANAHV